MEEIIKRHKRFFALFAVVAMLFSLARPEGYKQVTASETTDTEIATNNDAQQEPEEATQNDASAEFIQNEKVDESAKTLFVRVEESGASITVNAPAGSLPYPESELSLAASEIKEGTAEYEYYLSESVNALDCDSADSIAYARFFDIEILWNGEKVEPLSPVEIKIEYDDAPEISSDDELSIVHFAEDGTEVISDIDVNSDASEIVYEQESFSVTATIVTPAPVTTEKGEFFALIAIDSANSKVYIVEDDGSLTEIQSDNYDLISDPAKVYIDQPMMWTYLHDTDGTFIRYKSEGFEYNSWNQLASEYAYTFINPANSSGISTSTPDHDPKTKKVIRVEGQLVYDNPFADIVYDNGQIKTAGTSPKYLTINDEKNHIQGNATSPDDYVSFVFAKADNLYDYENSNDRGTEMTSKHEVDHIDISIEDTVSATIPLAYGTYYDENGKDVLTIDKETYPDGYSFDVSRKVSVSQENIRNATITAFKYTADDEGNYTLGDELDDAFYITGYSANDVTAHSTVQVRIEGIFKVSYMDNVLNQWDIRNSDATCAERLKKRVLYSVKAVEPDVEFYYDHPTLGCLYDAEGNKLFTTADVTVTAAFDYFNPSNECPPLQMPNEPDDPTDVAAMNNYNYSKSVHDGWLKGAIVSTGMSGMDFKLKGTSRVNLKPYAIEIENMVMDKDGNPIIPAEPITFTHSVYVNKNGDPDSVVDNNVDGYNGDAIDTTGYEKVHNKKTEIDNTKDGNGTGIVYDYSIPQGMVYVTEDASTIPATFVDVDGNTWEYSHTYIETEYVWRENDSNNGKRHFTDDFDDASDSYSSIPEVVGEYGTEFNKFLEFYVRNVYDKVIPPTKKEFAPYEGNGTLGALQAGDKIVYEISYTNYKSIDSDVIIKDTLDKNVEFVEASDGGKLSNGVVTWNISGVDAGAEGKVTLTVRVLDSALESNGGPGKVVNGGKNSNGENTATVQIGDGAAYGLEEVINPVPESPVKQEVSPYKGTGKLGAVKVDDEITYEISYKNYKDVKADIVITDKLDGNVEYVSSSDDGAYNNATRVVKWTLKDVPAGKEGTVTLKVKVLDGALKDNGGPGIVINGGDDSEASNGSTAAVTVGDDIPYILDQVENPVEAKEEDETPEDTVDDTPATDEEETPDKEVGNLVITVVEEETSRVVPEAEVEVIYPDKEEKTYTTDEVGRVTLKDVPVGDYTITIKKVPDGYKVSTTEVLTGTVVEGKTTEVEFKIVVTTNTDKTAKTDDPTQTGMLVFVMILSAAGIIFLADRKRKNRNEQ